MPVYQYRADGSIRNGATKHVLTDRDGVVRLQMVNGRRECREKGRVGDRHTRLAPVLDVQGQVAANWGGLPREGLLHS